MRSNTSNPKRRSDPGLTEIDRLERLIVEGRVQLLLANGVEPEELERERKAAEVMAADVSQQLRAEYRARTSQS